MRQTRLSRTWTLVSAFLNVWIFNGSPDETVSGRAWRERADPVWARRRVLIDRVFFFQPDHCETSHALDRLFAQSILFGA